MWYSRTEKSCSHPPSPGFTAREADSQACLKQGWKAAWLFRTGEEEEVQGECFSRFCLTRWIDRPVSGHLGFLQEFVTWNRGANCEQRRLIWGDWNPRLVNCLPGTLFPTGRHWYLSTLPDLWQNRELLAKKEKKNQNRCGDKQSFYLKSVMTGSSSVKLLSDNLVKGATRAFRSV